MNHSHHERDHRTPKRRGVSILQFLGIGQKAEFALGIWNFEIRNLCPLPAACCPLPAACCPLPAAYCPWLTSLQDLLLRVTRNTDQKKKPSAVSS